MIKRSSLCGGNLDDFKRNYQTLNDIGKGSFGAVYKILDKNKRIFEAMKRMPNKVEDYKLKYVEILHEL